MRITAVPQPVKRRHTVVATSNGLAMDDAGAGPQAGQSLNDQREAPGEIIAWPAVKPNTGVVLPGNDPEAIVFNLVQPKPAGWRFGSSGWKARRDEAGRENTTRFEHSLSTLCNGFCREVPMLECVLIALRRPW